MNSYTLLLQNGEDEVHLLSPFSKEELKNIRSKSELFYGRLIEPSLGVLPGNISFNRDFLVHLHSLVRDTMVNDPEVIANAKEQPNGFVFIIDRRSPAAADKSEKHVDKEDIIGIFLCNDFKTDGSKYRPNPDYRIVTEKGVSILPEEVEKRLRELISTG